MNGVMANFNTTMLQMTELFQSPKCLGENMAEIAQRKKIPALTIAQKLSMNETEDLAV